MRIRCNSVDEVTKVVEYVRALGEKYTIDNMCGLWEVYPTYYVDTEISLEKILVDAGEYYPYKTLMATYELMFRGFTISGNFYTGRITVRMDDGTRLTDTEQERFFEKFATIAVKKIAHGEWEKRKKIKEALDKL